MADDPSSSVPPSNPQPPEAPPAPPPPAPLVSKGKSDPPVVKSNPEVHLFMDDGSGALTRMLIPEGFKPFERRITIGGRNYEHTSDHQGCWVYRSM